MSRSDATSSPHAEPPPVLILCADKVLAEELIRELAGRRYQPLVAWPGLSWRAALEWARPDAVVVDTGHPAARSDGFLATSDDRQVKLVVFGAPPADARLIGGAVDAALRRQSA